MKHESYPDTHHDVTSNTLFGFWVYLMTDFILFATLFAAYAVLRNATFGGPSAHELLSLPSALAGTLILLTSSFTCGMAMLAIPRQDKTKLTLWFAITFLLGLIFLFLVGREFVHLIETGNSWQRNAFLSAYFTLIGTHALHIGFGLLFMALFVIQSLRWGLIPVTIRRLSCLSLFWFFSYVVWIFMFTIVYLLGAK